MSADPKVQVVPVHELTDWERFDGALRLQLAAINHQERVLVRNFDRVTFNVDENDEIVGNEVNRLQIAIDTGTDRDRQSKFSDAEGHDHEHDRHPTGKNPEDIIYAYIVDAQANPYNVYVGSEAERFDLTIGLSDGNAILIYDATKFTRASKNEHWFKGNPKDALLMIFIIGDEQAPKDASGEANRDCAARPTYVSQ